MENPIVNTVESVEQTITTPATTTAPVVDIQEKTNEVINNLKNDINEKLIKEEQSSVVHEQVVAESEPSEPAPVPVPTPAPVTETNVEVQKESVSEAQVSVTEPTPTITEKPNEDETVVNAAVTNEAPAQSQVETVSEVPAEVIVNATTPAAPATETATVTATTSDATTTNKETTTKEKKKKEKKEKKNKDKKSNDENVEPGTTTEGGDSIQVKRKESVGAKIKRVFTLGKSDKNKKNAGTASAGASVAAENGQTKPVVDTPSTVDEKPESNGEVKQVAEVNVTTSTTATETVPVIDEPVKTAAAAVQEVPVVDAEAIAAAGDPVPVAKDVELVTEATVKEAACALEAANANANATGDAQQDAATATSPIDKNHKQCIII